MGARQRQPLQHRRRRRPGGPGRGPAAAAAAARVPRSRPGPEQRSHEVVDGDVVKGAKGGLLAVAPGQPAIDRVERNAGGREAES